MGNVLTDFIQYSLYPQLFESIDRAFPEMDFRRVRGDWHSSKKLSGEDSSPRREDKTVITKKLPSRIMEQGGESLSLVSFWLEKSGYSRDAKGAELVEALRSLCGICGLTLPETDSEDYRAYRERQDKLERITLKMQRDLFNLKEADSTLWYLTEARGYSEELIKAMGLGYCSRETASQLEGAPYGAGEKYTLAIPYRSGSSILGFKLRTIEGDVKPKYKNTEGLPKRASLFGLTGLVLSGNGAKDRDLTIVEGELDALHAQAKGLKNIVASAGGEISPEALQEAKKRGVKRVTVLFDTEETEKGQLNTDKKKEKAIRAIRMEGLEALVAELPALEGEKMDVDQYLLRNSPEELQTVIDRAETGAKYLYSQILQRAIDKQGGEGVEITDKVLLDCTDEVIALCNDYTVTSQIDRDIILTSFERSTGKMITKETLKAEADRKKAIADYERQKRETVNTAEEALKLAKEGQTEDALRLMLENSKTVSKISREAEYSTLLSVPSGDSIREKLRKRPEGVNTGYVFSSGKKEERLVLPSGALTLICGAPSHGKSTLLRNLALQTALNGKEGTVLYFTLEEDSESTIMEFLNTYLNTELTSGNNLSSISEYYRQDSTYYIKKEVVETFKRGEAKFMEEVIESGKLRVFDNDYKSGELINAIEYLSGKVKVKAVFVDYVQLLYKEHNRLQRNEELKEIAKDLRELAKSLKLPLVLGAQYSRKAGCPTEMCNQYIADSADLEREANKVIGVWNTRFKQLPESKYNEKEIEEDKRPTLGVGGKLYLRQSKNRGGVAELDALLDFVGNTGVIVPNYVEQVTQQSLDLQEGDMPEDIF